MRNNQPFNGPPQSYATVNLTCLLLDLSGTPNFRPQFRLYSRAQSLAGFALCIGTMFYFDVWYSVVSCSVLLALFFYISYRAPAKSWGDVSQSLLFHQVRKYLLRLNVADQHPKNWRPSVLLLLGPGRLSLRVVDFCNSLKKGGLYAIGDVVVGDIADAGPEVERLRAGWMALVKDLNIKAIPDVTFAKTVRLAFQQLVLLSGLGGLKPNSVCVLLPRVFKARADGGNGNDGSDGNGNGNGRKQTKKAQVAKRLRSMRRTLLLDVDEQVGVDSTEQEGGAAATSGDDGDVEDSGEEEAVFESEGEFVDVLRDVVVSLKRNLLLACRFDAADGSDGSARSDGSDGSVGSDRDAVARRKKFVDVWMVGNELAMDGSVSLSLQLAHILNLERRGTRIRIINVVDEYQDLEAQEAKLADIAKRARLHSAACVVVACRGLRPLRGLFGAGEEAGSGAGEGAGSGEGEEEGSPLSVLRAVNAVMVANSQSNTRVALLEMPGLPVAASAGLDADFVKGVHALVDDMPPVVLVLSARRENMIAEEL